VVAAPEETINGLGIFAWAVETTFVVVIVLAVVVAVTLEPLAWLSAAFVTALLAVWVWTTTEVDGP
jgi:hypothetical protein